jgi:uroporphyrinogen-III synthase
MRLSFLAAMLLAGCVGPAPAPILSACGWDKIIHPSQADTIETLRQVDEHNKSLRANCPDLAAL